MSPAHPGNFLQMMEAVIANLERENRTGERAPTLLLHSCCAPCSTSVIASLADFFRITVFYYNPNIDEREEYERRAREQERLLPLMPVKHPPGFLEGEYRPDDFLGEASRYPDEKEGGLRCTFCYALRLGKTARTAKEGGFDFFATTLTVSPMKDAARINAIGNAQAALHGTVWLPSDFKKKDGYKKSVELSKAWSLYRQDYCGCSFSKRGRGGNGNA